MLDSEYPLFLHKFCYQHSVEISIVLDKSVNIFWNFLLWDDDFMD